MCFGITLEFSSWHNFLIGLPPFESHSELSVAAPDCDQICIELGIFVMTIFLCLFLFGSHLGFLTAKNFGKQRELRGRHCIWGVFCFFLSLERKMED